ncbi:MAG: restriction endonuclease subunit S [Bacilli bacterium]|nr:restriction endonuclease subunit S [Bacilli bacterium]
MKLMSLGNCCVFDRSKQLDAASIQELVEPTGDIRLLPSSKDFDWKTTRERAGSLVCHGPIITMGKARYANIKYCEGEYVSSNNMLIKPRDKSALDCRYLFHFLKQNSPKAYVEGTTYPKFDLNRFNEITMPLPPLDHQKTIASFFDFIEEQINGVKAQISLLDEQVKSLFNELILAHTDRVPLSDFCDIFIGPFGSALHESDYVKQGHPLVNPKNIVPPKIEYQECKFVGDDKFRELSHYHLKPGDVVLGRRGEMGRCAVVTREGCLCGTGSMVARPKDGVLPFIIQSILSSDEIKATLEEQAIGVTMANLNSKIVASLMIPKISILDQKEFANRLEQIDKLRFNYQHQIDLLNELLEAKMEEYFGGAFDAN